MANGLNPLFGNIPPPIDLGKINVQAPQPQIPPQAQNPLEQATQKPDQPFFDFLKAIGIPLATAGIGVGVPGALPGAAGFQQGFVGAQEKQREKEEEALATKDFIIVDPETGEEQIFKVPKSAQVQQKRQKQAGPFGDLSALGLDIDKEGMLKITPKKEEESRVRVVNDKGETGTIPRSQLGDAKKQGFRIVN